MRFVDTWKWPRVSELIRVCENDKQSAIRIQYEVNTAPPPTFRILNPCRYTKHLASGEGRRSPIRLES
jgi:hypothetical protein